MPPAARIGTPGKLIAALEGQTEADLNGVLVRFLCQYGNMVGPRPHLFVGTDRHSPIVNMVLVGASAKGRKGLVESNVARVTHKADQEWADRRIVNGHASGEAILADLASGDDDPAYPLDPRLLVVEAEFSKVMKIASRDGSILSEVIRQLFDGKPIANRRAKDRVVVKRHHATVLGSITLHELRTTVTTIEAMNGFANRFLWVLVRRRDLLPFGGHVDDAMWDGIAAETRAVLNSAKKIGLMHFAKGDAEARWAEWYRAQAELEAPGILGSVTARSEAITLRLAMTYALLEASATINLEHVNAAIAVWECAAASAAAIFGDRLGDRDADRLLDCLREIDPAGVTRTEQYEVFGRSGARAERAREVLLDAGLAEERERETGGRPERTLFAVKPSPQAWNVWKG